MQFTVPQFIEKEGKIVGPLTFKQFIFVGTAGGLCIFLYFIIPFNAFIVATIVLVLSSLALAFLKIEKTPLPIFIKNVFVFLFGPKVYLWQRKNTAPKIMETAQIIEEENPEESTLKISSKSRLENLFTKLETRKK